MVVEVMVMVEMVVMVVVVVVEGRGVVVRYVVHSGDEMCSG